MKLLLVFLLALAPVLRAAEPFLKPHDVIALVGGEDMVAASEYGYLELLLQRALPQHQLKVRSLAWEGDTVFEQPRDLNYPTLDQQLDEIGATVVIMQFGQMESLAGTNKLPEFIKAYEKLIERVSAGGKRRVILQKPPLIRFPKLKQSAADSEAYADAIQKLGESRGLDVMPNGSESDPRPWFGPPLTRDGLHATPFYMRFLAAVGASAVAAGAAKSIDNESIFDATGTATDQESERLRQLIAAKNRLWFHYTRPQNWAFLAGDRTEQPSSRDHKDPSKRWFPEEMKQWLPLIDAKEKEIWALAAKAAKP